MRHAADIKAYRLAADVLADRECQLGLRVLKVGSIEQIAQDCGFSSPSYLARLFREEYGCSPGEYRKK